MEMKPFTRRSFLAKTAAVAPMVLASGVIGAKGQPGANDRIVTGHIGIGGMGRHHLGAFLDNVAVMCDVDQARLDEVQGQLPRPVDMCTDYREVLDRKDIDAVLIAAPDHWHGIMAVHACQAGKDVYCEKPACKTVEEGQAMVKAAKKYDRVMVVGSQGRQHPASAAIREYIEDGMIGEVQRVECWHVDNPAGGDPTLAGVAPETLDWDRWLGPSMWRIYNPDYCRFNFRWMLDYGGGQIRDRGAHVFSVVSWCLGIDEVGPSKVTATGQAPTSGIWDVPQQFYIEYEFEEQGLTVTWDQRGARPVDYDFGAVFIGTKGKTVLRGGDGGCAADQEVLDYLTEKHGEPVTGQGDALRRNHENWLDCIRTRETPLMNITAGAHIANMCILGNLSYRLERPLVWDNKKEAFVDDPGANRMLGGPGRGEYRLPVV